MSVQDKLAVGLIVGLMLGGCGKDLPPIDEPSVSRHGGSQDTPETAFVAVDELGITTTFDAEGALVTIPVETLSGVGNAAALTVEIVALNADDEAPVRVGTERFSLTEGATDITVRVPDAVAPATQALHAG